MRVIKWPPSWKLLLRLELNKWNKWITSKYVDLKQSIFTDLKELHIASFYKFVAERTKCIFSIGIPCQTTPVIYSKNLSNITNQYLKKKFTSIFKTLWKRQKYHFSENSKVNSEPYLKKTLQLIHKYEIWNEIIYILNFIF